MSHADVKKRAEESNDLFRTTSKNRFKQLLFSLPVPVSVNHMYRNTRYGGKRLNKDAERYTAIARAKLNEIVESQNWGILTESEWFYVDCVFYFPDRKIRDASNCLKLLLDVMQGIVYANDYYCLPRIQSVELDKDNPRVDIRVHMQSNRDREGAFTITEKVSAKTRNHML